MIKKCINNPSHDAVVRNVLRILIHTPIPEDLQGEIYSFCFSNIISKNQAVAIRAFSLSLCTKVAYLYPELKEEVLSIADLIKDDESAAMQSAIRNCKKKLKV